MAAYGLDAAGNKESRRLKKNPYHADVMLLMYVMSGLPWKMLNVSGICSG